MPKEKKASKEAPLTAEQPIFIDEHQILADKELDQQMAAYRAGAGRCPIVADDGEQCRLKPHPGNPDSHQFGDVPARPVDGGKRWSDWIKQVNNLRQILLGYEFALGTDDGQKLAQCADALGLFVIASDVAGKGIVADDPDDVWQTYKEVPE
jgi:hypothetical protein